MSDRPMGLVLDMPAEQYHSIDAMSSSGLKLLARSAWHYKNRVQIVPTKPMLRGTLAHCAALEPEAMASRYVIVPAEAPKRPTAAQWKAEKPSPSSKAAMDWWREFNAQCEGREIVSAEDYAVTQMQLKALAADPTIAGMLASGFGESSVFWIDPETGIYCKARPDWVHPISRTSVQILDLKSTADESPSGFGRAAARMGYHLQQAHYAEGFALATGKKVDGFAFAAVTSAPPVLAVPYILTDEIASQGVDERRELLELYARCKATNTWPAYGQGLQMLDFPAYAKRSQEVEFSYVD